MRDQPNLFTFTPDVTPTASPVLDGRRGVSAGNVLWDKDADMPASGVTPAAKRASATGAMAAADWKATRIQQLLVVFLDAERGELTIAEGAVAINQKEGNVCGPWNRMEHKLGWIEGTGRFYTWTTKKGRPIAAEYHRLTARGREIAQRLREQKQGGTTS